MGRQLWWLYPRMTSVQLSIPWILDYTSCYFIQILTLLLISWLITINIHKHEEIWLVVPILKRVGFTYTGTISLRIERKEWRWLPKYNKQTKKEQQEKKSYRITVHHLHPPALPPFHFPLINILHILNSMNFLNSRLKKRKKKETRKKRVFPFYSWRHASSLSK